MYNIVRHNNASYYLSRLVQRGVTLIELVIVFGVVSILVTILEMSVQSSLQRSRDQQRISDIHQLRTELALYYQDNGKYPHGASCIYPNILGSISSLVPNYTTELPQDPMTPTSCTTGNGCYYYLSGPPIANPQSYMIYYNLENISNTIDSTSCIDPYPPNNCIQYCHAVKNPQ